MNIKEALFDKSGERKQKRNSIMLKIKQKPKKATFKRRDNYARKKIKILLKYLRSEFGSSTTHGLPYIVSSEIHCLERVFWAASFVISAALIYALLSAQYTRFMAQPIVMSVEKDYFNWNVSFPAIMLCPLNKVDENLLMAYNNESMLSTDYDITPYIESIASTSFDAIHSQQVPEPDLLKLINASDYARIAGQVFKPLENGTLTSNTDWHLSVEPVMTEMGMCHMINSNVAVFDNPEKWSVSDVKYNKNNIELSFHDQDFFVQLINYADSYKIYAQNPDDVIIQGASSLSYDEEGFLTIGVQMSSTKASQDLRSMPLHMRKCRFVDEPSSARYPVYSYNRCLIECRIKMIVKICGCVPHFYRPMETEKVCNLDELRCLNDYVKDVFTLSTSNTTLEKFNNSEDLPKSPRDCECLGDCESSVYLTDQGTFEAQEGFNRLRVTVNSYPKVRILRERVFSFYDMLLRSGGVVNLCIGTSVISGMELLMTFIRIPIYEIMQLIHYCVRKNEQNWVYKKNK